jgi:hypothetical protein
MVKLDEYRVYIKQLLTTYSQYEKSESEVEAQTIFDTEHDHYQLVYVGWENKRRVYGCVLHLDIKNGKIWIQHNGTEANIADELVAFGVPKQDIVLGFHSAYKNLSHYSKNPYFFRKMCLKTLMFRFDFSKSLSFVTQILLVE